jgi:hypothetical protein
VRQRAQREGVLVDILAFEQQLANKISAANVVHQVAEFFTAERVVAKILDDRAPVSIGVRLFELVFRESRISLEEQGPDLVGPEQIHDFLVRQNGVCGRTAAAHQHDEKKCRARTESRRQPLATAPFDVGWVAHGSDAAENQKNDNDEKD